MKKTLVQIVILMLVVLSASGQAPSAFNYQGVARNTSGAPLATQPIGLKISIHDGSSSGTVVYQETFSPTTNAYGLYNVSIGKGTVVSGTFAGVNWATGSKYIEVAIDPAGGTSYTSLGANELLSVPYALYAANGGGSSGVTSVTAGAGLSGGTITGTGTISMPNIGTAGTYGSATQVPVITTDAQGRVTGVTNTTITSGGSGTVTNVATSAPLTGGPITSTGTLGLSTTGTAGTYGSATQVPVITTDAWGRVSGVTNTSVTGLISGGTVNYVSKFTSPTALGNSSLFDNGAQVGLGTATPTNMAKMEISGVGTYSVLPVYQAGLIVDGPSSASASGVYGEGGWRGVYGRNSGAYAGVEAMGVLGRVEGSTYTGTGYGVKGECAGTGGTSNYGVYGTATGTANGIAGVLTGGGTGAAGVFDGGTAGYGVIVKNGISGFNTTTPTNMAKVEISGVGTYSVGPFYQAGLVVDGSPTAPSATGVYGESGWKGVYGRNPGTAAGVQAIGVHGRCEGGSYTGAGYGVLAEAVGTGPTNYGIYASASGASGTNYAGYFSGNVHITGSIAKGSGTFMIDHPLDPENKYLYHSFVESPDMMNIYNGNVVTDANGDATVTMPDYFEALNKDFRYQLTVIGSFAQAIIGEEISGNTFKIKTDKPNIKVSWMVTGVRQDKYANAHRVVPEVEKEAKYKGYYLHAAEWGQPQSKSIDELNNPKPVPGKNANEGTN